MQVNVKFKGKAVRLKSLVRMDLPQSIGDNRLYKWLAPCYSDSTRGS